MRINVHKASRFRGNGVRLRIVASSDTHFSLSSLLSSPPLHSLPQLFSGVRCRSRVAIMFAPQPYVAYAPLPANCDRNTTVVAVILATPHLPSTTSPRKLRYCSQHSHRRLTSNRSYQLAVVNTGVIDPNCDNLYAGEVSHTPATSCIIRLSVVLYRSSAWVSQAGIVRLPMPCSSETLALGSRATMTFCRARFS